MELSDLVPLIDEQRDLLTSLERKLLLIPAFRERNSEMLGWCPEHAFVIATSPPSTATAPWHFSCGCPYTKARVVTYQEAIDIVKGIRHAKRNGTARYERDGIHINVVQYDGSDEDFESYCRQVTELFQMEEVRK